jgi:hypothetical protein
MAIEDTSATMALTMFSRPNQPEFRTMVLVFVLSKLTLIQKEWADHPSVPVNPCTVSRQHVARRRLALQPQCRLT